MTTDQDYATALLATICREVAAVFVRGVEGQRPLEFALRLQQALEDGVLRAVAVVDRDPVTVHALYVDAAGKNAIRWREPANPALAAAMEQLIEAGLAKSLDEAGRRLLDQVTSGEIKLRVNSNPCKVEALFAIDGDPNWRPLFELRSSEQSC